MEGRHCHPAVTEAARQAFVTTYEKEYRSVTIFATRHQSVLRPGGIEVMDLDTTSADMSLCRNLHESKDGKWLSASLNRVRF